MSVYTVNKSISIDRNIIDNSSFCFLELLATKLYCKHVGPKFTTSTCILYTGFLMILIWFIGDKARGHRRGRVDRVELEDRWGHNGKWSILRALRSWG